MVQGINQFYLLKGIQRIKMLKNMGHLVKKMRFTKQVLQKYYDIYCNCEYIRR